MTRTLPISSIALGLALTLAAALPASAQSVASCRQEMVLGPNGIYIDRIQAFHNTIAMELRQRGYNVESVEPWGGCVKAFITDPNGGSHMAFFDPDTLQPLSTR